MTIVKLHPFKTDLSGAQILDSIQRGHLVRRTCWREGHYIRICNEEGYDDDGYIIYNDRDSMLYTLSTERYFMHLGYSSQPFKNPGYFFSGGARKGRSLQMRSREGEGIAMLFATDWEDYGWISREDFDALTDELKDILREEYNAYVRALRDDAREEGLIDEWAYDQEEVPE